MSEKPPIVYGFCVLGACVKCEFPVAARFVPACAQPRADSSGANVTAMKQLFHMLSFRIPSFRNLWHSEFVQRVINIRLGTGRGFRYAYSEQLPIVVCTLSGVRPHAREDAFVEASSTPRLAMSATGEMEWVI
jgi:hypothetical protein